MTLPFDGAITEFYETGAPDDVRDKIANADKDDILTPTYPHTERMKRKDYEREMEALQVELVKKHGRHVQTVPREPDPAIRPRRGSIDTH